MKKYAGAGARALNLHLAHVAAAFATSRSQARMNSKRVYQSVPVHRIQRGGAVHLIRGKEHLKISGEQAAALVEHVLGGCEDGAALHDLFTDEFAESDIESIFQALRSHRFLLPADPPLVSPAAVPVDDPAEIFHWHFDPPPRSTRCFEETRLVSIGANRLCGELVSRLAELGLQEAVVIGDPALDETGFDLAAALPATVRLRMSQPDENECRRLLKEADLAAACAPRMQIAALDRWNTRCVEQQTHFLPLLLSDLNAYIGPLYAPGFHACFRCMLQRDEHNEDSLMSALLLEHESAEHHGFHPAMPAACAALAALELSLHQMGFGIGLTNRLVETSYIQGRSQRRPILPSPLCPSCTDCRNFGESRPPLVIPETKDAAEFIEAVKEMCVDSKCGIVRSYQEQFNELFPSALRSHTATLTGLQTQEEAGAPALAGGFAADSERAALKAIGESIERYVSAVFPLDRLPLSSFNDAAFPCVDPLEFASYAGSQHAEEGFPWKPFDRDATVRWTRGRDLTNQRECWLPAALVYCPYIAPGDEVPVAQSMSTGLAAHRTFESAALAGLCEIIERDAVALFWQSGMAPRRFDPASFNVESRMLLEVLRRLPAEVDVFDVTTDIEVPAVLAAIRPHSHRHPGCTIAAASALNPHEAVRKALEELVQTTTYVVHNLESQDEPRIFVTPDDVEVMTDHSLYWADRARLPDMAFLFSSNREYPVDCRESLEHGSPERDLAEIVERARALGESVYAADITTSDAASLGFYVVRSLLPGFVPLQFGHRNRLLGAERLLTVPAALGYQAGELHRHQMPHPFP